MSESTNARAGGKAWFALAVLAQLVILAAVPARHLYALRTGTTVVLKTVPVDPYDIMRGYYVTLGYEVARPPGVQWIWRPAPTSQPAATTAPTTVPTTTPALNDLEDGEPVYVTLTKGAAEHWEAVAYDTQWPSSVPAGAVVLKGKMEHRGIRFGVEAYYMPETMRQTIADDLRNNADSALVEVKVDSTGKAALVRLKIHDRVYEY